VLCRRDLIVGSIAFTAGWVGSSLLPNINPPNEVSHKSKYVDVPSKSNFVEELRVYALEYRGIKSLEKIPDGDLVKIEEALLNKLDQIETLEVLGLEEKLSFIIEQDFISEQTSVLEGWVFSETELQLLTYKKGLHKELGIAFKKNDTEGSFETAKSSEFLSVKAWGPKKTCVGVPFNQQLDGHSSNWFSIVGYSGPLEVYFGGKKVKTTFKGPVATTRIEGGFFDDLTAHEGEHDIVMFNPADNVKQKIGVFKIASKNGSSVTQAGSNSKAFGKIVSWGPKKTKKLTAFNIQKDGSSALWIKTECPSLDVKVILGGVELPTAIKRDIVTARVDDLSILKSSGPAEVILSSKSADEQVSVGTFHIK